ncbi:electrogenic sodium bicarbonate cotransporter 1-like [Pecten maximus]|uniref:electrogenic sodium bicarbonate cotransporter 1-like n=1 Tax=Pecten maximus TaxID=6579 RepID=UPI001457F483|nr:electrogenic sodium bicarbonate cotransporter 1-like [Pecten maximus]XP_033728589.1 electrogenic sodium bicarbonate cotransporter 1-like [Pecten maximus]
MNNNNLVPDMTTTKIQEGDDVKDDENEDDEREPRDIFCQMGILRHYDEELVWKEIRRWVKFEEVLEEKGKRWSKPHVSSLYMQSLTELQLLLASNPIFLDLEVNNMFELTETLVAHWVKNGYLEPILTNHVRALLLKRHKHHHVHLKHMTRNTQSKLHLILYGSEDDSTPSTPDLRGLDNEAMKASLPDLTQVEDALKQNENSMSCPDHLYQQAHTPKAHNKHQQHAHLLHHHGHGPPNRKFLRKIPVGAEVLNILVGEVDALDSRLAAFVRLRNAKNLGNISEVPLPTRFLFIMLVPKNAFESSSEIGRCMGTLMTDPFFRETAYLCDDRVEIMTAVQEFASQVTVLPPGSWDPKTRIEPPEIIPTKESRKKEVVPIDMPFQPEEVHHDHSLDRTGRLFGGLINDIKRKIPWYKSDFTDALHLQCVASFFYLFLATLTPNVTFGGLLGEATHQYMGTMECILAAAVSGVLFALFSGQPLNILGSTGPMLILEMILYNLCSDNGWDFMPARVWVGIWTAVFLLIIIAFDLSSLVQYITRFTEDSFACLVAIIFIYQAVAKLLEIREEDPIELHPLSRVDNGCVCFFGNATLNSTSGGVGNQTFLSGVHPGGIENAMVTAVTDISAAHVNSSVSTLQSLNENITTWMEQCTQNGGILQGSGCDVTKYVPDVFLFSLILFLGTSCLAFCFVRFRDSLFCPTVVRQTVSDFSVLLAIVIMVGLDLALGLPTPKLTVPSEFKPTREGRGWFINPISDTNPWWLMVASALPAILATILVFMDQQITSVIVNRSQHKLKKGGGYHLDLLVVAVLIVALSLLGLPWYVAATVTAIAHVMSLKKTSECTAPGEKPTFLGVREQRVTGLLVGIFSGLAVLITSILQYIPMPVLYGVFFYMGVSALNGMQLVERILIVFMPQKYQPDYKYLRYVPLSRVHLFTFIQVVCLAVLWIVKSVKAVAISFPIMVVAICFIRKALEYVFDPYELQWLDSLLPDMCKSTKDGAEETTPGVIATKIKFARSLSVPASTLRTGSTSIQTNPDGGHQHLFASRKISTGSSQTSTVYGHHVCQRKISILSLPVNPTFVLDHSELQRVREERSVNFSLDNLPEV